MDRLAKISVNKKLPVARRVRPPAGTVRYCPNDPSTPDLCDDVPLPTAPALPISVSGFTGQDRSESEARAAACYVTAANLFNYILPLAKSPVRRWGRTHTLAVVPRAGEDLNAYYDGRSVKFFYGRDGSGNVVFTCDSADIVAHEFGHAALDAIRPALWNVQSHEAWAFHEAFADCMAVVTALQNPKVVKKVLANDIRKSNVASRLAEQVGKAVFETQGGTNPNALRDLTVRFDYVEASSLPREAPDNKLSREPHSFSRVFSGAWYDFLTRVQSRLMGKLSPEDALAVACTAAARYLLAAAADAPITARFFDAVTRQMLVADSVAGRPFRRELFDAFRGRKILSDRILMLSAAQGRDTRKIRFSDFTQIRGLSYNPLFNAEVEVPHDPDLDDARSCLDDLHQGQLVGTGRPFQLSEGRLTRDHVACRCPSNNACDPNAPEYGKIYKPQNNAGCCCKGSRPISCDCDPPAPTPPPRLGCYTRVKTGSLARVRSGGVTAIRVC